MTTLTVWNNLTSGAVLLHQLSDDEADGTAQEQIAHLATLEVYAGFTCVSENYTGPVPATDALLWRWNGSEITAITPVPQSITPRQTRLLLLQQNKLAEVEAMIAQQDEATKIAWNYASEFMRHDPLLNALAANLGLTEQQIDEFFIAASAL